MFIFLSGSHQIQSKILSFIKILKDGTSLVIGQGTGHAWSEASWYETLCLLKHCRKKAKLFTKQQNFGYDQIEGICRQKKLALLE